MSFVQKMWILKKQKCQKKYFLVYIHQTEEEEKIDKKIILGSVQKFKKGGKRNLKRGWIFFLLFSSSFSLSLFSLSLSLSDSAC
jgi:hypothetical protein